jgi:hypothetical protein
LDYLTQKFLAGGWKLKSLHREILLSATYRQTAHIKPSAAALKVDPANKYLWRFSPRRLDAEQARDAMLAASGELSGKAGGPSEDGNGTRRSIYTTKKRNNQNEMLRAMDAPAGFTSTSERLSTTTPTQALLMLNGEWTVARAQKLATRIDSVEDAWHYVLGRAPTADEMLIANEFLEKRSKEALPVAKLGPEQLATAGLFKVDSQQERIVVTNSQMPALTDEFMVEAVAKLDTYDPVSAAVRTIASHWTGQKDNVEAFGWSIGVTGEKSRFKPRNLIVQLVGEDENSNIAYEAVPSDLRLELGVKYRITVAVSCAQHRVEFRVQQVDKPNAPLLTSVATHSVRSGLDKGAGPYVIGGISRRSPAHHWDGVIDAVRIKPTSGKPIIDWKAKEPLPEGLAWSNAAGEAAPLDPRKQALVDLCHVLLNANEFFYLH